MQLKTNSKKKDVVDSQGKVKFSILKKQGKHKRGKNSRDTK